MKIVFHAHQDRLDVTLTERGKKIYSEFFSSPACDDKVTMSLEALLTVFGPHVKCLSQNSQVRDPSHGFSAYLSFDIELRISAD